MRALLDINVLIALFDADHVFNDRAHAWLESDANDGIATCPLTENGFVRIVSNPGYSRLFRFTPPDLVRRLRDFTANLNHAFWADEISLRDATVFRADQILGSRQITDIFLLGLATARNGRLVTFDDCINSCAVEGASPGNLHVIA